VLFAGVHLNVRVMSRPYGIRCLAYQGFSVILIRDLTDCLYDPRNRQSMSHENANRLMVEHIETYWCPSVTSDQITKDTPAVRR
jgi:hypothetical protein